MAAKTPRSRLAAEPWKPGLQLFRHKLCHSNQSAGATSRLAVAAARAAGNAAGELTVAWHTPSVLAASLELLHTAWLLASAELLLIVIAAANAGPGTAGRPHTVRHLAWLKHDLETSSGHTP